jgi:succinate dehydrogenase hydrophobic anchor subunit
VGHILASFCLLQALLSLDDLDALAMPTYTLGRGRVYVLLPIRSLTLRISHVQYKCTYLTGLLTLALYIHSSYFTFIHNLNPSNLSLHSAFVKISAIFSSVFILVHLLCFLCYLMLHPQEKLKEMGQPVQLVTHNIQIVTSTSKQTNNKPKD